MLKILFLVISMMSAPAFANPAQIEQIMQGESAAAMETLACKPQGGSCFGSHDCCFGLYCSSTGRCDSSVACRPAGSSCTSSYQCCTGLTCHANSRCR